VHEPVDPFFDLDEGTKVGQVADPTFELGVGRILLGERLPRIRLGLLETERDLLVLRIDLQHHDLDLVANSDDLRGMAHVFRP
jgi:hypothetical protein